MQDLKYGLRMIAKNPVFSAVAIMTLALGIGANTAIYTVVEAVLLEPLPFEVGDRRGGAEAGTAVHQQVAVTVQFVEPSAASCKGSPAEFVRRSWKIQPEM